jgi:geranylgeranylglycerol-phosphate geranylgeranyltransferase
MWKKTLAYIEMTKVFSSSKSTLYYGFCTFIGSLLASAWKLPIELSFMTALAMTLSSFAIYALNDIYDAKIDAINNPQRPIPSNRVTMREAKVLTKLLFVAGAAVAITVNLTVFLLVIFFLILGVLYSLPPIRFKDGLFANFCWGLGMAITILAGASIWALNTASIVAAFILGFLTAGCGLTKDLKDLEGDRAMNVHTLPIILGERKAIKVMTVASIVGFPLLFLDLLFKNFNIFYISTVTSILTLFGYSLLILYKNPGSKIFYKKAYNLQAGAGVLVILAFVITALT